MVMAMNLEQASPQQPRASAPKPRCVERCWTTGQSQRQPSSHASCCVLPPGPAGQAGTASTLMSLPPPRASAPNYNEHHWKLASSALEGHPSASLQRRTPGSIARPSLLKYFREERHLAYPLSELSQERVFT